MFHFLCIYVCIMYETVSKNHGAVVVAPPRGLSTPRALSVPIHIKGKVLVAKYILFLRICTICCMREAATISNGSRILSSPQASTSTYKLQKTKSSGD